MNVIIDSGEYPKETILVCDVETNGKEGDELEIVCIGVSGNGEDVYVYFNIHADLINLLRTSRLVCHNAKGAEIPWLARYGVTIEHLHDDTQIMAYVSDSSRKTYGLKKLSEDMFGAVWPTYDELTTDKKLIEEACLNNPDLYAIGKKGSQLLPRQLSLKDLPKEIVANYNAQDIYWTYKLWMYFREHFNAVQWNFYRTIELPMTKLIYEMEQQGVMIDTKAIRRIHNEHSKERRKAKKGFIETIGIQGINPNSPKQLLDGFRRCGIVTQSTAEEALQPFSDKPVVANLLKYRKHQKVCSTYTIPLYVNAVKDKDNRIHARFSQNTITGRLSSSDPVNLQNQPQAVREAFIAKEGHSLIGADWSNIELRLPAHFAGEMGFIEELSKHDGDLHNRTARLLFGDNVFSIPEAQFKEKRAKAKTCNFLLTNSGTAKRLASELQVEEEEAKELYKKFWEGYHTLAEWMAHEKRQARSLGGISTWFGRWVNIPQLKLTCGRSNCSSLPGFCKQCFMREEAERSAISIRVQGTAADMCKLAALRMQKEKGIVPVLAVHDELDYEISDDKVLEISEYVLYTMSNITTLNVPLVVNVKTGKSWSEAH